MSVLFCFCFCFCSLYGCIDFIFYDAGFICFVLVWLGLVRVTGMAISIFVFLFVCLPVVCWFLCLFACLLVWSLVFRLVVCFF